MGSVGDDYRCPLCGRIGNGGYVLDGVGYPICTDGDHSCLWYQIMQQHRTPNDIISLAIQGVLQVKPPVTLPSLVYSMRLETCLKKR